MHSPLPLPLPPLAQPCHHPAHANAPPMPAAHAPLLPRYADGTDYFCMMLGALGAVGNGAAMPMFSILFGGL